MNQRIHKKFVRLIHFHGEKAQFASSNDVIEMTQTKMDLFKMRCGNERKAVHCSLYRSRAALRFTVHRFLTSIEGGYAGKSSIKDRNEAYRTSSQPSARTTTETLAGSLCDPTRNVCFGGPMWSNKIFALHSAELRGYLPTIADPARPVVQS